jgi:capsular polysaccharide export protein
MAYITQLFQASMFDQMLFPNDIEGVLMEMHFNSEICQQAAEFRQKVLMNNLARINHRRGQWRRPVNVEKVILVMGQVESDPSLKYGAHSIRTNLGLLKAVCQANADAYIVYKPHPLVWADMQRKGGDLREVQLWCDECVGDRTLGHLLPKVNEVHVMTSLAGFEALVRGKKVSCYGRSFYAGWGLTHDMVPMPNRPHQLNMDELIAGALFSLPRYMHRLEGRISVVDEKAEPEPNLWRPQLAPTGWAARV